MSDTKNEEVKQTGVNNIFNALDQQEVRQLINVVGVYVRGAVEPWEFDGKKGVSGWIQILSKSRSGSAKLKLVPIKVNEEQYGYIELLNDSKTLQPVALRCEIVSYGDRSQTILIGDQPSLKLS
jgi:hypothetical protein